MRKPSSQPSTQQPTSQPIKQSYSQPSCGYPACQSSSNNTSQFSSQPNCQHDPQDSSRGSINQSYSRKLDSCRSQSGLLRADAHCAVLFRVHGWILNPEAFSYKRSIKLVVALLIWSYTSYDGALDSTRDRGDAYISSSRGMGQRECVSMHSKLSEDITLHFQK
jgi:hypothetical protein